MLEIADRLDRPDLCGRRVGIERILSVLFSPGPARAVGSSRRGSARRTLVPAARAPAEQVVGALGPQPVGQHELPVEVLEALDARQPGQLVDHHLGLRAHHRLDDLVAVKRVSGHRRGAECAQHAGLLL